MNTILVPLDGSELSREALPYARALATHAGARLHLLHAIADAPRDEVRQQAEAHLQREADTLREQGVEVSSEVVFQSPPVAIVETGKAQQVDMIVMATHGYGGVRRWALGSITDEVVHTTSIPVCVIRCGRGEHAPATPRFARLLVPLDGSELSRKALPVAADLAVLTPDSEVRLLRAISPPREFYEGLQPIPIPADVYDSAVQHEQEQAEADLYAAAETLRASNAGISVDTLVVGGRPEEAIIDEATSMQADAIVMATHGYGGLERLLIGSVADKVLHATTTPLVLIHARAG